MGCRLENDVLMNIALETAVARRRGLGPGASLKDDTMWRREMQRMFGRQAASQQSGAGVPKVRGILEEPTAPRGVLATMKGRR